MRRIIRIRPVLLQLLLLSLLSAPSTAAPLPLSAGDFARLREGEIVFKGQLPSATDAPSGNGGTAFALLHANSEEVWQVLTDFDHYAGLFPRLAESEMVAHSGARALVRFRVAVGPFSFRFFVNYLAQVKGGEEILITERGKPVAKIIPLARDTSAFSPHLLGLERAGVLRLGTGRLPGDFWKLPRPRDPEGRALKALLAEREEGR